MAVRRVQADDLVGRPDRAAVARFATIAIATARRPIVLLVRTADFNRRRRRVTARSGDPIDHGTANNAHGVQQGTVVITVVSGLPRSGTSLVMQMLAAGGHPVLSDGIRAADDDNPRGYLEFDRVKSLERDQSWLAEADGKAVKIISFLLPKLPAQFEYRVIFLRRDLDEVIRSQETMLARRGQPPGPSAEIMKTHFERHLKTVDEWLAKQPNFRVLNCTHGDLIQNSRAEAEKIAAFLEKPFDIEAMLAVVDPGLHRQRTFT